MLGLLGNVIGGLPLFSGRLPVRVRWSPESTPEETAQPARSAQGAAGRRLRRQVRRPDQERRPAASAAPSELGCL